MKYQSFWKTNEKIEFFIEGIPEPAIRPRIFKKGDRYFVYTPKKVNTWMKYVRGESKAVWENMEARKREDYAGRNCNLINRHVGIKLEFYLSEKDRLHRVDVDNLAKATLDGMVGGILKDDRFVYDLIVTKRFNETSGVRIKIWRV
ncbi:MAG: RusA family crossover junction endodeoxyribonuclease [Promethearchaeota archaeon]